jgi:hypothetical protein
MLKGWHTLRNILECPRGRRSPCVLHWITNKEGNGLYKSFGNSQQQKRATLGNQRLGKMLKKKKEAAPGIEPGSSESKSDIIAIILCSPRWFASYQGTSQAPSNYSPLEPVKFSLFKRVSLVREKDLVLVYGLRDVTQPFYNLVGTSTLP